MAIRKKKTIPKPLKRRPTPAQPPPPSSGPVVIHVLSDSTGNLAQHMLTAFLTQFPPEAFVIRRQNFLQSEGKLDAALEFVAAQPGILFHAVVGEDAKRRIASRCEALKVPACDLTGPFVDFIAKHAGVAPRADVRSLHDVGDEYLRRIRALEFTLEHDDGLGLETLHEADIVLAGVSRTSKSPTSIYLAQQGFRVANVSLAMQVAPPKQLLALRKNVVGLVIDPAQLAEIRTNRNASWNMSDTRYNDPDEVKKEVAWSRRLFTEHGWRVLDITDQAVEETAARVVEILGLGSGGAPTLRKLG